MNEFEHLIENDEEIISTTKPEKAPYLLACKIFLIICGSLSIISLIVALFFIKKAEEVMLILFPTIYFVFFTAICLVVFFVLRAKHKNFLYCITNKKLIIRSGILNFSYRTLELISLTTIDLNANLADKICGGETASILFYNASNKNVTAEGHEINKEKNSFLHIKKANETFRQIKELINRVKE